MKGIRKSMLKRAMMVALVVGTVLNGINQGELFLSGQWHSIKLWKLILTYMVPFFVSLHGAYKANSEHGA